METQHPLWAAPLRELLTKAFPEDRIHYIDNYDDNSSCYRVNPDATVMIQIQCSWKYDEDRCWIKVSVYNILAWTETIAVKHIYSGDLLRTQEGDVDWDFLAKILTNYSRFAR